jgi:hypothetical protein
VLRRRRRTAARGALERAAVRYYRSAALVRVPYPTKYGLRDACSLPTPLMHIENRLFIVQIEHRGATKTVLLSPSDLRANAETAVLQGAGDVHGPAVGPRREAARPDLGDGRGAARRGGHRAERVDYISYDHLHTQDVRPLARQPRAPRRLPHAKAARHAARVGEHPGPLADASSVGTARTGIDGCRREQGDPARPTTSCSEARSRIVATPGHTEGNHSFVVRTPEGLMVTSENGVCCDAYAPLRSRIPGVARYARRTGAEVVF